MTDIEKVIDHLNECMELSRRSSTWMFVRKDIINGALVLLKEQGDEIKELRSTVEFWKEKALHT